MESMFSDLNQEGIRLAISSLPENLANEAFVRLLPSVNTPEVENLPRSAFAIKCLAEEPKVSDEILQLILDAAVTSLEEWDRSVSNDKMLMDQSFVAIGKSVFAERFQEHLINEFINETGNKRLCAGLAYLKTVTCDPNGLNEAKIDATIKRNREGIKSENVLTRVATALLLMDLFFLNNGELSRLNPNHRDQLFAILDSGLSSDSATIAASMWALCWFTGTKLRKVASASGEVSRVQHHALVTLTPNQVERAEQLIRSNEWDEAYCPTALLLMTRDVRVVPVAAQFDWIYNLAVVADGGRPRRDLPNPQPQEQAATVEWLLSFLGAEYSRKTNLYAAIALGSYGIFRSEMAPTLWMCLEDSSQTHDFRNEALVYLALIGDEFSRKKIVKAADRDQSDKDDFLSFRGLFGLLLLDDVDLLAEQLTKPLPLADLTAYASGLAGSRDPRGMDLLLKFTSDSNQRIATSAKKALSMKWVTPHLKREIVNSIDSKLEKILSFVEELKLGTSKLVMTYRARDERGEDFFAYILCDRDGVLRMKQDFNEQKSGAAKDYGEVLYADFVKNPDDKAKDFLKKWLAKEGGEMLS